MKSFLEPWHLLLLILAGWINRRQQGAVEYLRTENQILKEKLGKKRISNSTAVRGTRAAPELARATPEPTVPSGHSPKLSPSLRCCAGHAGGIQRNSNPLLHFSPHYRQSEIIHRVVPLFARTCRDLLTARERHVNVTPLHSCRSWLCSSCVPSCFAINGQTRQIGTPRLRASRHSFWGPLRLQSTRHELLFLSFVDTPNEADNALRG